jgi:hypothetical protein
MAKGDRRRSMKMRRRKAQVKKKERAKRVIAAGRKAAPTGKASKK